MTDPAIQIVVSDANVLINLIHVARLDVCAALPGLKFVVPDHVREEITLPEQRATLDWAVTRGHLQMASITEPGDIALFADLTSRLGRGEAACLVLAVRNGWIVASDEKRRFRREALSRIGEERVMGTVDIYIRAIRAGVVTVEEADRDKSALEGRNFKMPLESFNEIYR